MANYIDVHHHILPSFYNDAKFGITLPDWSVQSSKDLMAKHNITAAITSISTPGVNFGDLAFSTKLARQCNDFAANLSVQYPKTYGGFATLPLPYMDETLDEIVYALDVLKMEGVTLLSNYDGKLLGNAYFEPMFAELDKRNATVFIHPTIPSPCCTEMNFLPASMFEFICDSSRTIINMLFSGIFEKYPAIKFIVPHAGGTIPYLAGRINLYETFMPSLKQNVPKGSYYYLKKLYYDTAMSTSVATLRCLTEFVAVENILMGTDYPFVSHDGIEQQIRLFEQYPYFSDAERELIQYKNMHRLFPRFKN
jgi:predicted TIM-barrel fold metal-dependent hydrolase